MKEDKRTEAAEYKELITVEGVLFNIPKTGDYMRAMTTKFGVYYQNGMLLERGMVINRFFWGVNEGNCGKFGLGRVVVLEKIMGDGRKYTIINFHPTVFSMNRNELAVKAEHEIKFIEGEKGLEITLNGEIAKKRIVFVTPKTPKAVATPATTSAETEPNGLFEAIEKGWRVSIVSRRQVILTKEGANGKLVTITRYIPRTWLSDADVERMERDPHTKVGIHNVTEYYLYEKDKK